MPRQAAQSSQAVLPATSIISELLKDRDQLKMLVVEFFRSCDTSADGLDLEGLARFRAMFVPTVGVPEAAFGDLCSDFIRFDFDGSERLNVNEVYKLVKFHLWEYWKKAGNVAASANVPSFGCLEDAGYISSRELGNGSQAVVKLCTDRNGSERCIKCYRKSKISANGIAEIVEEFEAMKLLGCRSIARTYEIFQDSEFLYMVNEVYYGGDFTTLRSSARAQRVATTEAWWRHIFRQCLRALEFMHQHATVHCDIKEANLMFKTANFNEPEIVVVDFGISEAMGAEDTGYIGGTPGYMPPETFEERKWYPNGDIFSLGVVMFHLLANIGPGSDAAQILNAGGSKKNTGLFTSGCRSFGDIYEATKTRQPPFELLPQQCIGAVQLLRRMLEKELKRRPKAPQALADPWFSVEGAPAVASSATAFPGGYFLRPEPPALPAAPRQSEPLQSKHPLATCGILPESMDADRRPGPVLRGRASRPP